MKNYKLVLALVAGLAIGSTVGLAKQPVKSEASVKYETPKQAGERWYKGQTKAYKGKKKVTLTFNIKGTKKQAYKFADQARKEAAKAQYGDQFISMNMTAGATDTFIYTDKFFEKVKNSVYRYKITINGKQPVFRRDYREAEADRKLLADLTPLTEGKSQFDKAFITMAWFQGRAGYQCGRNQDASKRALWNRNFHADCDDLASSFAYYAKAAGVKKVRMVSDYGKMNHSWNYIVVNGRMYFVDLSGLNMSFGRKGDLTGKEFVEKMYDIDFVMKKWSGLKWLNDYYKKNVDANAEDEISFKAVWNKMPKEYKEKIAKLDGGMDIQYKYELSCDSWSQTFFLPVKIYCTPTGGGSDWTPKKIKKLLPKKLRKYVW